MRARAMLLAQYRKTAEEICGRKLEISGGSSPTGKYVAQSGRRMKFARARMCSATI